MQNSKVRKVVLVEHEGLRAAMGAVEALLERAGAGEPAATAEAERRFKGLLEACLRHIEHEERILRPVLIDVDAWGEARVATMDEEHHGQRKTLRRLSALCAAEAPSAWAAQARAFIAELRRDMAREEETCLSPKVLRDDIITVDADTE